MELGQTSVIMKGFDWIDRLGLTYPLLALLWSWILGRSMSLVYYPFAPYFMLFLGVWVTVLLTRFVVGKQEYVLNFPGGNWCRFACILISLFLIFWYAGFIVGFGIAQFILVPLGLLVLYAYCGLSKRKEVSYLLGGFSFAYSCAVPVWYSAAIYSFSALIIDRRTICVGILMSIALFVQALWKRFDNTLVQHQGEVVDWEEIEAEMIVKVSFPLVALIAVTVFFGYYELSNAEWVYYAIALSGIFIYILGQYASKLELPIRKFLLSLCLSLPAVIIVSLT